MEKTAVARYAVQANGDQFSVYEKGVLVGDYALYSGTFAEDSQHLLDEHHHGSETHTHSHAGPHTHQSYTERIVGIDLPKGSEGMSELLRERLLLVFLRYQADNPPLPESVEVVEQRLDNALRTAILGYRANGMRRQEIEDRIRDRIVAVSDSFGVTAKNLLRFLDEAIASVEVTDADLAEIERLGREDPLDPLAAASMAQTIIETFKKQGLAAEGIRETMIANLKASGVPMHWYVADHHDDDAWVVGPFDTQEQAAAARAALEFNPEHDEKNLCIYQGWIVNLKVIAP